jgi:hypothetical protein
MSESSAATVGMAIERFARDQFAIVSSKLAQVLIVDADRIIGRETLQGLSAQHPGIPLVVLSSSEIETDNGLVLKKPVSIQGVLEAVRSIRARAAVATDPAPTRPIDSAPEKIEDGGQPTPAARAPEQARKPRISREDDCCGDADDILVEDRRDKLDRARTHFDDRSGLLGAFRTGVDHGRIHGKAVTVTGLSDALYVDAGAADQPARAISRLDDGALRAACASGAGTALQFYTIAAVPQSSRDWRRIGLESMLWNLSVWSSQGRLPDAIDANARVRLTRWPNFTRCAVTPHALRIAALWVTRFLTPLEVASVLGVPQRYVFAVCTAAEITGLLERPASSPADGADTPAPSALPAAPAPTRGLFRRILGKLLHAR